jgi:hypothetical protein
VRLWLRVSCFDERNGAGAPFGQEILSTVRPEEIGHLEAAVDIGAVAAAASSGGVDGVIKTAH